MEHTYRMHASVSSIMLAMAAYAVLFGVSGIGVAAPVRQDRQRDAEFQKIARWISDLGSEKFEVRYKAQQKLVEIGPRCRPQLEQLQHDSGSAEVRYFAKLLLETIEVHAFIHQAIQRLASKDWKTVKQGLSTIVKAMGHGEFAKKALRRAARGGGDVGAMAKAIWTPVQITILMTKWNPRRREYLYSVLPAKMKRRARLQFRSIWASRAQHASPGPSHQEEVRRGKTKAQQ